MGGERWKSEERRPRAARGRDPKEVRVLLRRRAEGWAWRVAEY